MLVIEFNEGLSLPTKYNQVREGQGKVFARYQKWTKVRRKVSTAPGCGGLRDRVMTGLAWWVT